MPDDMNNSPMEHPESEMRGAPRGKTSVLPWAILLVVILAVLLAAVMFRDRIMPKNSAEKAENAATQTTPSGYQSVFMANGQVYFGKLSNADAQYMVLRDVYYLQLIQPPGLQGSQQGTQAASDEQPQLTLRKLGRDELHGPVDEMKINRDFVLFYEEINEEGAVMKAIRQDQQDQASGKVQQNQTQNQQAPASNTPANAPAQANTPPANNTPANR